MRVLILNYEYPPLGGGAGNATYYILKEFSGVKDVQVDLVTSSTGNFKIENPSDNVSIHYLDIGKRGDPHFQSIANLVSYSLNAFRYSKKLVKKNKYDLTHAFFGIPCGFIAMHLDIPYIVSLRGSDVPFYNERFRIFDKLIFHKLSRRVWSKAKAVIALSKDLVGIARKTSKDAKIEVIYNGINIDEFYPDENKLAAERTFNILFVGRLIKRKGLEFLLEAVHALHEKYPDLRLIVAGGGPLMECYKNYCKEKGIGNKVSFLGVLGHDEINEIYQKSHVMVLPSINEALGNVTLEALAAGLPVITTPTGASELIADNGIIVKKESSDEIVRALEKLINDEKTRKSMGEKSRQIALGMGWQEVASKYLEIYETIAGKSKNE